MPSDFPRGMSDYQPMLGMRILQLTSVNPGLDAQQALTKYNCSATQSFC